MKPPGAAGGLTQSQLLTAAGRSLWSGAAQIMSRRSMRPVVRVLTCLHVALYRCTGGRAQMPKYPTLLLTVTGRRTGQRRTVALVYIEDGADLVVAAAYAGSDREPEWWLNLRHDPTAVVEINGRRRSVRAEETAQPEREQLWGRLVAMYPPFAEYQGRTTRQIPVVRLLPADRKP